MKHRLDYLFLFAPAVVWGLSTLLLGDRFSMPNRLLLAVLCTAAGAGAMLAQRKLPGVLAIALGLAMLAAVPVEHELPGASITSSLGEGDADIAITSDLGEADAGVAIQFSNCMTTPPEPAEQLADLEKFTDRFDSLQDNTSQTLLHSPRL